jgi:predicted ATPase
MRIRRLYLESYRVLRQLEIDFEPGLRPGSNGFSYSLDFLVGLNGSGKSTVLQAIAEIIRRLERGAPLPFGFELEYYVTAGGENHLVSLVNRIASDADAGFVVRVNGTPGTLTSELLPHVVAFTTGSELEWTRDLSGTAPEDQDATKMARLSLAERTLRELPDRSTAASQPSGDPELAGSQFTFIKRPALPILSLCGLLTYVASPDGVGSESMRLLLRHSGIERICGFSLRFRADPALVSQEQLEQMEILRRLASRSLRLGTERLAVFDLTVDGRARASAVLAEFGGAYSLFRTLATMQQCTREHECVLSSTSIFFERWSDDTDTQPEATRAPLHLFDWLSDGERSFLGRMCLFALLRERATLVLLDEPEVHFNDYWKRQLISLLDRFLTGQNSHVLITTHSSITLSDVPREDILVLDRPGAYTVRTRSPRMPTLAADPSDILVHVFGAEHASGQRGIDFIERILAEAPHSAGRLERLESLSEEVGPGYWSYRVRRALMTERSE